VHPSRAIRGRHSRLLEGRRIVIGVSGSIAAVEIPRIARELIRHGAEVWTVLSPEATRLLTPEAVEFATGHPPITQLTGAVEHVSHLGPGEGRADLLLLAPATANTLSKVAHGIDDTAVTTFASMALGEGVPVLVAPAMHGGMARNPAVKESLERLLRFGVEVLPPRTEEGEEKIATPEEVAAHVLHRLGSGPWNGRSVLIIGGGSRESIDDIRSIANESTGATAIALATEAYYRGASVNLWLGAAQVPVPSFLHVERWRGVQDLLGLVQGPPGIPPGTEAVLVPAAISDFTLSKRSGKISSREREGLRLELSRAPKILPEIRRRFARPGLVVGFKLESGVSAADLVRRAARSRREASLDAVVANDWRLRESNPTWWLLGGSRRSPQRITGDTRVRAGRLLDLLAPSLPRSTRTRSPVRRSRPRAEPESLAGPRALK
jgi:phosphopantothenoylcysteine decarboxylase / phosphopantothenate---cysteine ligase